MKIEKMLAVVLVCLVVLTGIVYFTLPEQGEQIYIPQVERKPVDVEIPEGYKLVENYTDVYFVEKEDGVHYYWLVQFGDGTYGWQEVDKDGNIIFPNRETETTETDDKTTETKPEETTPEKQPKETTISEPTESKKPE